MFKIVRNTPTIKILSRPKRIQSVSDTSMKKNTQSKTDHLIVVTVLSALISIPSTKMFSVLRSHFTHWLQNRPTMKKLKNTKYKAEKDNLCEVKKRGSNFKKT